MPALASNSRPGAAPPLPAREIAPAPGGLILECEFESPLGLMTAMATDEGVCLLEFTDRRALERERADLTRFLVAEIRPGEHAHLASIRAELAAYFEGRLQRFETPIVAPGTPWERGVWDQLLAIPYGETRCYEDIALALQMPGAQRAVGMANGRNRIAIVIPCHRVIQKGGGLRGYGGGLWRKARLLEIERKGSGQAWW